MKQRSAKGSSFESGAAGIEYSKQQGLNKALEDRFRKLAVSHREINDKLAAYNPLDRKKYSDIERLRQELSNIASVMQALRERMLQNNYGDAQMNRLVNEALRDHSEPKSDVKLYKFKDEQDENSAP